MERTVRRKRGRPNRGGGKFNRGRGRGRIQNSFTRNYEDFGEDGNRQALAYKDPRISVFKGKSSGSTKTEVKVPMQRLHMSTENQEMVREMLQILHGDEVDATSEEEYDELDLRSDDQYWMTDKTLYVEEATGYSLYNEDNNQDTDTSISPLAVNKLMRYGFDKRLSLEALQLYDGDIGSALEYMIVKCFDLQTSLNDLDLQEEYNSDEETDACDNVKSPSDILKENGMTLEDILEQRNDEMVALESIYESNFIQRIPNRVWIIKLELPVLLELIRPNKSECESSSVKADHYDNMEICKFYMKGSCRFGAKCKYKHVTPDMKSNDKSISSDEEHAMNFELEIRFPKNNVYPLQPPIVAFSSSLSTSYFQPHICLNITDYLLQEAKTCAESNQPAVFSMVSILDDETVLAEVIKKPPLEYSLPQSAPAWKRSPCTRDNDIPYHDDISELNIKENYNETEILPKTSETESDIRHDKEKEIPSEKITVQRSNSRELDTHYNQGELLKQNRRLKEEYLRRTEHSGAYKAMISQRAKLPAWKMQNQILSAVSDNQVVVISGMTGCGKTTQVPQFILDSYLSAKGLNICSIICTQPRRISAISVAERVAEERTEKLGKSVGYQIRLEKIQSSMTRLLFCTTGIVLRRLESDPELEGVTHIIIDEVHERSEESDFLLMYLRDMLPDRPDIKVLLMSATMNADLFSEYFNGCPVIDIPGKTFPVEQFFLEDVVEFTKFTLEEDSPFARPLKRSNTVRYMYDQGYMNDFDYDVNIDPTKPPKDTIKDENLSVKQLYHRYSGYGKQTSKTLSIMDFDKINTDLIISLLEYIVQGQHEFPSGAVLVFLPGFAEIQTLYETLQTHRTFGNKNKGKYKIIPLHSMLSSEDQHAVFVKPPEGVTKIVIATNIAETSITIDDIVFVIDAGKMKERRYDSTKSMESLDMVWVSRANALQRKGRAGRVTNGICFHLFTSYKYEYHLQEQPIPEIKRAPLEQIVLRIKMLDIFNTTHAQDVLEKLPEPPDEESIVSAINRLQDLGALDDRDELTPLGYHLGSLPVDVRIGKLMLFGAIFRCLDPALTIAATLSSKSPFVFPFDKKDEANKKKLEFAAGNSDHLTMVNAYNGWIEARKRGSHEGYSFCYENFLSFKSLQMLVSMKQQFVELLSDIGFIKEGITTRDVERKAVHGSDGVVDVTGPEANTNSTNWKLVSAVLVGALYPNVVQVMSPDTKFNQATAGAIRRPPKPDELKFKTKTDGMVHIHPSSINFQVNYYESPYLVYHEKVKTSKVYLRDCTMVSVYPLLLFGGAGLTVDLEKGNFILSVDDGWIRFIASSQEVAELMREVRMEMDLLLEDKIRNPHMDLHTCPKGSTVIQTIVKLITTQ